ncbi:hypothetical protein [Demequina sp. NBRC 110053]|uniref:hypothetical protein n=1 Tax=Demequina sp. NBRC 110053 TaxID=1570342 RepID=UPI000A05C643|nr:hypothetical protein [Demequina sp. NBRC 110053]
MSRSRDPRIARAALAAAVATFVALGSHVVAGGHVPAAAGVLVPLGLSFAVCLQLAGRPLSLWRRAVAVTLSQALFHTLFTLGSGTPAVSDPGHAHRGAGAAGGEMVVTGGAAHASHGGALMMASHIVAAIVTTVALHHAAWLLARAARGLEWLRARILPVVPTHSAPSVRRPRVLAPASSARPLRDDARGVRTVRGPPALSA